MSDTILNITPAMACNGLPQDLLHRHRLQNRAVKGLTRDHTTYRGSLQRAELGDTWTVQLGPAPMLAASPLHLLTHQLEPASYPASTQALQTVHSGPGRIRTNAS